MDGVGPVAEQNGEMVDLAGLAGGDDEVYFGAAALADQVVVQSGGGQQGGDGGQFGRQPPVAQHQQVGPFGDSFVGLGKEVVEGLRQSRPTRSHRVEDGQMGHLEAGQIERGQAGKLVVAQQRVVHLDAVSMFSGGVEDVALWPQQAVAAGDQLLADGVEGRVCYLGKQLAEVVIEQLGLVGQHGQRRVVAHRAERFHSLLSHRRQNKAQIFKGVSKRLLLHDDWMRRGKYGTQICRINADFFLLICVICVNLRPIYRTRIGGINTDFFCCG